MFRKRNKSNKAKEHMSVASGTNSLVQSNIEITEGRYFHGIISFISKPKDRQYFILDSKLGICSTFLSLS